METLLVALKAIAEPTRLRLLALLEQNELTVTELTQILAQSQPRVSRHLKLMAEAGLIDRFSEGTWAFYRVSEDAATAPLVHQLVELIPDDDVTLARDLERLDQIKVTRSEAAAAYFRESAPRWDEIRSLYSPESEVEDAVLDMLSDRPVDTLLDIGTGTGRMLEVLSPLIKRGVGVDLSREMLVIARANLDQNNIQNCQVRQGDMYSLNLSNEAVDLAIFHHVLHFANDPAGAVTEAGRVVGPRGRLLIVDFAPHGLEYLRTEHAHRRLGFSDEEVTGWCYSAGFDKMSSRQLEGVELTVCIWLAERDRVRPVQFNVAEAKTS